MARTKPPLDGVHILRPLVKGKRYEYHYAWRGGPRLAGLPGSPEYAASYAKAHADKARPPEDVFKVLLDQFRGSSEYKKLAPKSQKDYDRYLRLIEDEFGSMPLEALEDRSIRGDFMEWRDGFAENPRKADYAWTTLARVLSVAKNRGRITVNPCERGGRLYQADRVDSIWAEADLEKLFNVASPEIGVAVVLALWTGQRQGDLLRLAWTNFDGERIRLRQSKTGARVTIPAAAVLKDTIAALPRLHATMLTSSDKTPWTSDGFRASFRKTCLKAGVEGLTFHDLRGTAITRLALAGCEVPEIAAISGHSMATVTAILDAHYLSKDARLAESAMAKLEGHRERMGNR